MSISSEVRRAGPYSGNGSTTAFAFAFKVFTTAQVVVTRTVSGVETTLTLTTDYTVSLNANQNTNPGGTVTMLTAPATGQSLTITSNVANLQPTAIANLGGFYPEVINDSLDRATIQIQQLDERLDRALVIPVSSSGVSTQLPAPEINKVLGWNGTGTAVINYTTLPPSGEIYPVATYAALTATPVANLQDDMLFYVASRSTDGDGGHGVWRYDAASTATANGGTVLAIDGGGAGRFFRLLDAHKTHHVAWFGALGSATHTVNTNAIQACSAAIEALGTGRMEFDGSASYAIYGDATDTDPLGDFDNCKGVHLAFNGCTFTIARAFTGTQIIFPWVFEGCDGVSWGDHTVTCTQQDTPADAFLRGINWISIGDRNSQVSGGFLKQTGGKSAVDIFRASATATNRTSGVRIKRIEAANVGYPLSLRNSGDDVDVGYVLATDVTRPVIAYGFKNLSAIVERVSTGAAGETQMLFMANGTGADLALNDTLTEGVELWYKSNTAPTNSAHIAIEARGTSGVTLRDFDIHLDIELDGSGGLSQQALAFFKTSTSGVYDSTTRGHTLEDFALRGNIRDVPATRIFDFFKTSLGDWAGETIRNFRVRDLVVTGSASATYEIDFDGFTDGPTFENFIFPGTPVVTGTVPDTFSEVSVKDKNGLRTLSGGATLRTPGGRLTLTSATPVTVSDVTAAATIYYAIDRDNRAPFWMGFRFAEAKFTELSLALSSNSGHTGYHQSGKNFDVFLINDAGTLRLATGPAWTSDTARGTGAGTTELARSDGFMTNAVTMTARFGSASGNTVSVAAGQALYVGTFRCTANGQTDDSFAKHFVWNAFNRRPRAMRVMEGTDSWSGSGAASWRQANNSTANQLDFVRGVDEDAVSARTAVAVINSTGTERQIRQGIGLDSTSAIATGCFPGLVQVDQGTEFVLSFYAGTPGLGWHYLAWLEHDAATDTRTYYGDAGAPTVIQSGITGEIFA